MSPKATLKALDNSAPTVGALLMLAAAFLFSVLDGLIKLLGPPFRVWDIAFYRFACGLAILLPVLGWKGNPFSAQNRRLLVVRGVTGCCAFLALVAAIRLIPISTALVLFFSFPAFAAFFSPLIFKETITRDEILFVVAALGGVAILFDFSLHTALLGQARCFCWSNRLHHQKVKGNKRSGGHLSLLLSPWFHNLITLLCG